MVFVCVIWSFDDMGLGEQVILSDKESKEVTMKVQGNRYINNPEMIKNKVEKKTTVPQNIISEVDVKISIQQEG